MGNKFGNVGSTTELEDGNGRVGRALIHVVLRRRRVAEHYVPPISVLFARERERYIRGFVRFRDDDGPPDWIEHFGSSLF